MTRDPIVSENYPKLSLTCLGEWPGSVSFRVTWPTGAGRTVHVEGECAETYEAAADRALAWAENLWRSCSGELTTTEKAAADAEEDRRAAERAAWDAQRAKRQQDYERRCELRLLMPTSERNEKITAMYAAGGRTYASLGREFAISTTRVQQIIARAHRRAALAVKLRLREEGKRKGRPIDMGGPRGVWMTFTPEDQAREFGLI